MVDVGVKAVVAAALMMKKVTAVVMVVLIKVAAATTALGIWLQYPQVIPSSVNDRKRKARK